MQNLKTKISKLLIGTIFGTLLLSLFAANSVWAKPAGPAYQPPDEDPKVIAEVLEAAGKTPDQIAADKAAADAEWNKKNDLTEGTFNVTKNLTLDNGEQPKKYFSDANNNSPIVSLVITVIDYAITIMGAIAVILFIVAGFMFMTSQGNSQKLDEAKDVVKYAALGLIVALLSYVITIFIQSIFSNG